MIEISIGKKDSKRNKARELSFSPDEERYPSLNLGSGGLERWQRGDVNNAGVIDHVQDKILGNGYDYEYLGCDRDSNVDFSLLSVGEKGLVTIEHSFGIS